MAQDGQMNELDPRCPMHRMAKTEVVTTSGTSMGAATSARINAVVVCEQCGRELKHLATKRRA